MIVILMPDSSKKYFFKKFEHLQQHRDHRVLAFIVPLVSSSSKTKFTNNNKKSHFRGNFKVLLISSDIYTENTKQEQ